jgi:hypothetical protein
MTDLRVTTISGMDVMLEEAAVTAFKQSLRGQLIAPGDERYEEARQVWNADIDRRPGLICRPAGVGDVITAVNFARDHTLLVAVRGGAHSFAGIGVCNGGLVIDLCLMKGIRVDPVRRTVRAEGGVKWGEFDRETQAFGLASTGGQISTTGIASLTLGGGWGYLARTYGLASDNLLSIALVTANGQLLTTEPHTMLLGVHIGSPGKFCGALCPGDIIYRRRDNNRPSACARGYRAACRQGAERFYHRMVTSQHLHRLGKEARLILRSSAGGELRHLITPRDPLQLFEPGHKGSQHTQGVPRIAHRRSHHIIGQAHIPQFLLVQADKLRRRRVPNQVSGEGRRRHRQRARDEHPYDGVDPKPPRKGDPGDVVELRC